jgi:hypothetical protein
MPRTTSPRFPLMAVRTRIRGFIEELLEAELDAALGRDRYERPRVAENGRPDRFPLAFREPCESEELVACFLQAGSDGVAFQPPFADERLALRLDLRLRGGVDHIRWGCADKCRKSRHLRHQFDTLLGRGRVCGLTNPMTQIFDIDGRSRGWVKKVKRIRADHRDTSGGGGIEVTASVAPECLMGLQRYFI